VPGDGSAGPRGGGAGAGARDLGDLREPRSNRPRPGAEESRPARRRARGRRARGAALSAGGRDPVRRAGRAGCADGPHPHRAGRAGAAKRTPCRRARLPAPCPGDPGRGAGRGESAVAAAGAELALLDRSEGALQPALDEALQAESLSREQFRKSALGLSEREALAQGRERVRGLDLAWDLAAAQMRRGPVEGTAVSRLAEEAIKSRALVLDTLAARQRTLALHPDAVTASKVEHCVTPAPTSRICSWTGISDPADAQAMVDRAERALAATVRAYQQELERGQPGLRDVRRALPEASALLSYFRTDGAYVAMVLRPGDAPPDIVPLGRAARSRPPSRRGAPRSPRTPDFAASPTGKRRTPSRPGASRRRSGIPVAPLWRAWTTCWSCPTARSRWSAWPRS
jgi:hypothetical protein